MSLSSVKSGTALRSRLFSVSDPSTASPDQFEPTELLAPAIGRDLLTPIWRIASTMPWPCETRGVNLPQLGDNLFRLVPLPQHIGPP